MIGYDGHKKIEGTKIHAAVTEGSLPVTVMISAANIHEGTKLIPLIHEIHLDRDRTQAEEETEDRLCRYEVCDPIEQVLSI